MNDHDYEFLKSFDNTNYFQRLINAGYMRTVRRDDMNRMIAIYESVTGAKAGITCRTCITPIKMFIKNKLIPLYKEEYYKRNLKNEAERLYSNQQKDQLEVDNGAQLGEETKEKKKPGRKPGSKNKSK